MQKVVEQIQKARILVERLLDQAHQEKDPDLSASDLQEISRLKEQGFLNEDDFDSWTAFQKRLDTQAEWNTFVSSVSATGKSKPSRGYSLFRLNWISAAASVAVIAMLALTANWLLHKPAQMLTVAESNIVAGTTQAVLILGDGEQIQLEDKMTRNIDKGSVQIINTEGVLEYHHPTDQTHVPVMNTLKIPRGGQYQLVMSDGTKVWMNSDSELKYKVPFDKHERRVILTGEAYFEVVHNSSKPFIVETETLETIDLGTEFNVSAYKDDQNVITTLVSGIVNVKSSFPSKSNLSEILKPNEQLLFNKKTNLAKKAIVQTDSYISWKNGRFTFVNEPLETFLKKISRWYDVETFVTDEKTGNIRFSGDLSREMNLREILQVLEAEMSVKIEIQDNKKIFVSSVK